MHAQTKASTYIIKGRGGQGVFFLAKLIAQTLMSSGINNFSFLKECDEGQRNGEIKITFKLPFKPQQKTLTIKDHNMIELRNVVRHLNLNKKHLKKTLKSLKPEAFKNNLNIWLNKKNLPKK